MTAIETPGLHQGSSLDPGKLDEVLGVAIERGLDAVTARRLIETAPPLWSSAAPEALVDDLALVARPLGREDVRVRVSAPTDVTPDWEITVVAADRIGLLALTATVLAQNRLTIVSARIATWPTGVAVQSLRVRTVPSVSVEPSWPFIGQDIRHALLHGSVEVGRPVRGCVVRLVEVLGRERLLVEVRVPDVVGVLSDVASMFSSAGANIVAGVMSTKDFEAVDTLVIDVGAGDLGRLTSDLGIHLPAAAIPAQA